MNLSLSYKAGLGFLSVFLSFIVGVLFYLFSSLYRFNPFSIIMKYGVPLFLFTSFLVYIIFISLKGKFYIPLILSPLLIAFGYFCLWFIALLLVSPP